MNDKYERIFKSAAEGDKPVLLGTYVTSDGPVALYITNKEPDEWEMPKHELEKAGAA